MKLTKLQRYTAYCIMEKEMKFGEEMFIGFCGLIDELFDIETCIWQEDGFPAFREYFPEIMARITKDEFKDVVLFNNWEERKEALKQAIAETHPDNPLNHKTK